MHYIGLDFGEVMENITFTSEQEVGGLSCINIDIIDDSVAEEEETFQIVLISNELVQTVPPDVSTVFIS